MVRTDADSCIVHGAEGIAAVRASLIRGLSEPFHCLGIVLPHAAPRLVHHPEVEHRQGMPAVRSLPEEPRGLPVVMPRPALLIEYAREHELGLGIIALLNRQPVPLRRLIVILLYCKVHLTEVALRVRIAVFSGLREPAHSRLPVLPDALPAPVHLADAVLRAGMALVRGLPEPLQRLRGVLPYSATDPVHVAEHVLRVLLSLYRRLQEAFRRRGIVHGKPSSFKVHMPERGPGRVIGRVRRLTVPSDRLIVILWHCCAFTVHEPKHAHGLGTVLFRRSPDKLCRLAFIPPGLPVQIHEAQ